MSKKTQVVNMIKQQLRTNNVLDETILNLYEVVKREEFVPYEYANFAYSDMQIPLKHHERMMTPLEEALILQSLKLTGKETVLEIGTGTGFFTAMLSHLAKKVISIDYHEDFIAQASRKLDEHHINNVELIHGDASQGWLEQAPYDIVVFTGALEQLTETHKLQVLPGGQLFAVVGKSPIMQGQLHSLDRDENWSISLLYETDLPLLLNKSKPEEFVF